MDYLEQTSDQILFQETAERYAADLLNKASEARNQASSEKSEVRWKSYAELGWLSVLVPEDCGGMGGSLADASVLLRGVAPALVREPLVTSAILCASIVSRIGNTDLRANLLNGLADGTLIMALVDNGLFDTRSPNPARATLSDEGYILNGSCLLSRHAPSASRLIVAASVADTDEPTLFLVDPYAPGVHLDCYDLIDETSAADVSFENVSAEAVLLTGQAAEEALDFALGQATMALAAEATGIIRELLTITSDHLSTRVQFGKELRHFQALQHRLAEMFTAYQDAVSIVSYALKQWENSENLAAVSSAKVVTAEAAMLVGKLAIQLHGAMGVTEESRVGQYYKRLLLFERIYGSPAFHLARYQMTGKQS